MENKKAYDKYYEVYKNLFDDRDKTDDFFNASKMLGKNVLVTNAFESYMVEVNGLSQDGFLCGLKDGVQTKIVCGDVKEV